MEHAEKVQFDIANSDGNAFALIGGWKRAARREGWSEEEIDAVYQEADPDIDFYRHIDILNLFSERIPNNH